MGTDTKKDGFIKIRVSQEQKDLFKGVATKKGISVTELLIVGTEELIARDKRKIREAGLIEPRVKRLEMELEAVKKNMEERKQRSTKGFKWFR